MEGNYTYTAEKLLYNGLAKAKTAGKSPLGRHLQRLSCGCKREEPKATPHAIRTTENLLIKPSTKITSSNQSKVREITNPNQTVRERLKALSDLGGKGLLRLLVGASQKLISAVRGKEKK